MTDGTDDDNQLAEWKADTMDLALRRLRRAMVNAYQTPFTLLGHLHARVKKQTQYAHRARGLALQQKFGPAMSEAAEPVRCHGKRDLATPYISSV